MDTETKKALLEGMSGFLQGAQIGQFNMFVESGAISKTSASVTSATLL